MQLLEERILQDGQVRPGDVLKVDCFLNHQLDIALLDEIGKAFYEVYKNDGINKILTIEASGIAIACMNGILPRVLAPFPELLEKVKG